MRKTISHSICLWLLQHDHRFLYLCYSKPWFRRALLFTTLLTIGTTICALPLLQSTPAGVTPEIRISVIDWLQSRSLAHSARALASEATPDSQFRAWVQAIGNDQGNLELNREYLTALLNHDALRSKWHDAVRTVLWLQRLAPSDTTNFELACQIFEHYGMYQLILDWVGSDPSTSSPMIQQCHLRALFHRGNHTQFLNEWEKLEAQTKKTPSLLLYHSAVQAARTRGAAANHSQQILEQAKLQRTTAETAHRLQLRVSYEKVDLDSFLQSWNFLKDQFAEILPDHLLHWELLWQSGHEEAAHRAARSFNTPPRTPSDILDLADTLSKIGLPAEASYYLSHYAPDFGVDNAAFRTRAQWLIAEKKWRELIRLSFDIRNRADSSQEIIAYSYFLEGKAEAAQDRVAPAAAAFKNILNFSLQNSSLSLYMGSNLRNLGYPEIALAVLTQANERYRNRIAYWEMLFDISRMLSHKTTLLRSAENLYRLAPSSVRYQANYASLLISQRIQLEKALSLTFDAYMKKPQNPGIQINYGQALLLNGRNQEALRILARVSPHTLDVSQRHGFHATLTELLYREDRRDEARTLATQVLPEMLLPWDRVHFLNLRERLN